MPPACPVEVHACAAGCEKSFCSAASVSYHGASPWHDFYESLFLAANVNYHGASPWHDFYESLFLAANVNHHGASPWHFRNSQKLTSGDGAAADDGGA